MPTDKLIIDQLVVELIHQRRCISLVIGLDRMIVSIMYRDLDDPLFFIKSDANHVLSLDDYGAEPAERLLFLYPHRVDQIIVKLVHQIVQCFLILDFDQIGGTIPFSDQNMRILLKSTNVTYIFSLEDRGIEPDEF